MEKFWKKFVESDTLDRSSQLKVIVDNIMNENKIEDAKLRRIALNTTLLGYFEDLIEYMESTETVSKNEKGKGNN